MDKDNDTPLNEVESAECPACGALYDTKSQKHLLWHLKENSHGQPEEAPRDIPVFQWDAVADGLLAFARAVRTRQS